MRVQLRHSFRNHDSRSEASSQFIAPTGTVPAAATFGAEISLIPRRTRPTAILAVLFLKVRRVKSLRQELCMVGRFVGTPAKLILSGVDSPKITGITQLTLFTLLIYSKDLTPCIGLRIRRQIWFDGCRWQRACR